MTVPVNPPKTPYESLFMRLSDVERELRILLATFLGTSLVCSDSRCQRQGYQGPMPAPHVYLHGECIPHTDREHVGARECQRCGSFGRCFWTSLPRDWWRTTADGVTWQAAWLCADCLRSRDQVIPKPGRPARAVDFPADVVTEEGHRHGSAWHAYTPCDTAAENDPHCRWCAGQLGEPQHRSGPAGEQPQVYVTDDGVLQCSEHCPDEPWHLGYEPWRRRDLGTVLDQLAAHFHLSSAQLAALMSSPVHGPAEEDDRAPEDDWPQPPARPHDHCTVTEGCMIVAGHTGECDVR